MSSKSEKFEKFMSSSLAARVRGKMGVEKGNRFLQEGFNKVNNTNFCGFRET